MVEVPKEDTSEPRQVHPTPASEVMSVSADGVLIHLRNEGWKEVKVASISAVTQSDEGVQLSRSTLLSRRLVGGVGLWPPLVGRILPPRAGESKASGLCQRWRRVDLEPDVHVLCLSHRDSGLVACRAAPVADCQRLLACPRSQSVDEHSTASAGAYASACCLGTSAPPCPRGVPVPPEVRQVIAYFFANRQRMRYALFRQAGYPIGSGTVESACKVVVQQRMKQAGMRWSRSGAQAMLALRSTLLGGIGADAWAGTPSNSPISGTHPCVEMDFLVADDAHIMRVRPAIAHHHRTTILLALAASLVPSAIEPMEYPCATTSSRRSWAKC